MTQRKIAEKELKKIEREQKRIANAEIKQLNKIQKKPEEFNTLKNAIKGLKARKELEKLKRQKKVKDALNTYIPVDLTSYKPNSLIIQKMDNFEEQRFKQIEDVKAKQLKYKESLNRRVMRDEENIKLKEMELQNNFSRETLNNKLRNYITKNEIPEKIPTIITDEIKLNSANKISNAFQVYKLKKELRKIKNNKLKEKMMKQYANPQNSIFNYKR